MFPPDSDFVEIFSRQNGCVAKAELSIARGNLAPGGVVLGRFDEGFKVNLLDGRG